ncbi:MAG: YdcF family protein [Acidobacteria bacterium]|nr:YdcF family protein [Acidobacteriota bacterium]
MSSVYAVPYAASRLLVWGYQPVDASPGYGRTAIVVLGSADHIVMNWDHETLWTLDLPAAARVWEAMRLYRAYPDAWVISSGGRIVSPTRATAITMRDAMVGLGVPASQILLEDQSMSTRDQAVLIAPMLRVLHTDRVILVTGDIHMRRSVGAFHAVGVSVIPAIARDPLLSASWPKWVLPSPEGFALTERVAHEVAGIGYYAARGWFRPY